MSATLKNTFDRWLGQVKDSGYVYPANAEPKDFKDLIGFPVRLVAAPEYSAVVQAISFNGDVLTVRRSDGRDALVPFEQLDRWEYAPQPAPVVEKHADKDKPKK